MNKKQVTNIEVKKNNRNRVFRYIHKHGTVSNPDISYDLKISLPTVTQITKELIEKGIVEEKGELKSTGGRRAKALSIAVDVKQAIGLDIEKNHITLVLVNLSGEILNYQRIYQPYTTEDYYEIVNKKLENFLEENGVKREKILGIGISFPGIVDLDRQMIAYSHILGVKLLSFDSISQFFSYPCFFLNDANAGAYAEGIYSEERERFFYLSLSNTVGGSIFSNNELVQGKNYRCGEVGHMTVVPNGEVCYCGKKGCLDAYCSANNLSNITDGRLEKFFTLLEQNEQRVVKVWDEYTDYLAVAINNLHMILDCDIVLGGYVGSYVGENIQGIWNKVLDRNTFVDEECFVKVCQYKIGVAALGAALNVIENFMKQI